MFPFLDPKPGQNSIRFKAPSPSSYSAYIRAVQRISTDDTPTAFGLHANCDLSIAESAGNRIMKRTEPFLCISSETRASDETSTEDPQHEEHRAESVILDILDACKGESLRNFNIDHLARLSGIVAFSDEKESEDEMMRGRRKKKKTDEQKKRNAKLKCARNAELKFAHVFLQECARVNLLLDKIRSSLRDVERARKGERDTDAVVESMFQSICQGRVPKAWSVLAYPSERSLMSWFSNMIQRVESLRSIAANKLQLPLCTWLPGLFNPKCFLYALKCAFVAKSGSTKSIDIDTVSIETSVLNMQYEDVLKPARKGVYVYGLSLEGARWDMVSNTLEASRPKVMFSPMPVVNMKVTMVSPKEKYAMFRCPLYQTRERGPGTHLLDIDVRTKLSRDKWILAGVALILDVGDDESIDKN